jgi:hypothetical protein
MDFSGATELLLIQDFSKFFLQQKLLRMKRRIKNDNDKREMLALPVPESEIIELPEGAEEEKSKDDKPVDRSHSSSRSTAKISDRHRSPPRRRFSPPPYRGLVFLNLSAVFVASMPLSF